jgi:hypothetical protein
LDGDFHAGGTVVDDSLLIGIHLYSANQEICQDNLFDDLS